MIIKHPNGKYEIIVRGQDTERFWRDTEEEAIRSYIGCFAFMNNCPVEEVEVPRIMDRSVWPEITVNEVGGFDVSPDQVDQALGVMVLQMKRPLKSGYRYKLITRLEKVQEDPPFSGAGI